MDITKIFNDYLEFCSLYRRPATHEVYRKTFKLLSKVFEDLKIKNSDQLNQDTYNQMISYLKKNTIKKNSKINTLVSDFTTALRYSNITINFHPHKLVDDTTHYKSIPDNELLLLIDYLKKLDLRLSNNLVWATTILLMLDTGARKNEALNIESKDIDFSSNIIYLETTKNKKRGVRFGTLSKPLIQEIFDSKHDYLLWNRLQDKRMTKRSIEKFLEKVNKDLKLPSGNIHPHRFRKTFATRLLKRGCPLTTIQRYLGHSDIKMTMIYLDVDIAMLSKDYDEYYPFDEL